MNDKHRYLCQLRSRLVTDLYLPAHRIAMNKTQIADATVPHTKASQCQLPNLYKNLMNLFFIYSYIKSIECQIQIHNFCYMF